MALSIQSLHYGYNAKYYAVQTLYYQVSLLHGKHFSFLSGQVSRLTMFLYILPPTITFLWLFREVVFYLKITYYQA